MTREQIEKAANIEMLSYYSDEEYPCGIKDIQSDFIEAFSKGAQFRISSVWLKPSAHGAELIKGVAVIAKTKLGYRFGKFDVVDYSREYIGFVSTSSFGYALSDVLEYAYLDDLLPERKEETK